MEKKLKIIIFDGSFKTTPFINRLVKGLAVHHQVDILGFNERLSKKIEGVGYIPLGSNQNKFAFVVTTFKWLFYAKQLSLWMPTVKKLVQGKRKALQQQHLNLALKKSAPDVIHLQWPSVLPWFETVLLQNKIPVVLSQRGFHSNVRPFVAKSNFDYLAQWYPKLAGFHSVSKAISANGDKVWTSSKKIDRVVYTGLTLEELPFSETHTLSTPLQLISVGRAHWIKGYDDALRCCSILKEKKVPFQYTILGGAGDEELQFLIHELGLQDCVLLETRLPQKEVFKRMREACLLVMSSLEEGLPNVVVEAMAIGLPVLSTACGGVPEVITHGIEGWLVPTRNPQKMATAIEMIANVPVSTIENVRLAARAKVATQHSEARMIAGMKALYAEVVKN